MNRLVRELAGYGTASICALALDMMLLWILVQYFSVGYLAAAAVSFLAGTALAYALAVRLAFKEHRLRDRRTEFVSFVALGALGLAINAAVLSVAIRYFGIHYLLAKCAAAGCTFICNFVLRRQLLFVRPDYVPVRD